MLPSGYKKGDCIPATIKMGADGEHVAEWGASTRGLLPRGYRHGMVNVGPKRTYTIIPRGVRPSL